ncbi:NAD-dependent epimerase/dehydratase family protein [Leyella stercorea]|uniref:NAD-dependent epimerase/dehydratase family protein n=1 Tax=Leyella stercorea TaxID=363265 RepID=UPI00242B38A6|nr:NAD(P)-dependent oxidoreductase [Leyella stercorea]
MSTRKILICGATSFVAKGFKELLIQQGFDVDTFGRKDGSYLELDKNPMLADSYEAVVNFAVLKDQNIENNVSYMKSLVEMCKQKHVKKLIHFSSIMVYSYHLGKLDENSPIDTVANTMMEGYGKIKIACDEFLNSIKQSLPFEVVMVRPGYVLADNRPAPFIKRLPCGASVILGNKKSRQPIVKREDIHLALLKIIETDKNLPVYHLFQNNDITKYNFAKQTVGGLILVLPKFIFEGLPRLMMKMGMMKKALYSRFDGMYNYNVASSTMTESKLNIKFK